MSLFNNYSKPGPGIDKNAPKKKGIRLFLDIFGRKFFQLIKANVLCSIVSIPFFVIILYVLAPQITEMLFANSDNTFKLTSNFFFSGIILNFYGAGPVSAAYAYITRAFTREKHVWMLSDGLDKFKENFKQSIILFLFDMVFLLLLIIALRFYAAHESVVSSLLYVIICSVLLVYSLAHIFTYQIMVTFECKLRHIIKNSLILAVSKLPMCLLLTVLTGGICVVTFGGLRFVSVIVYATIGMSFARFPLEFYAARVLEKNI